MKHISTILEKGNLTPKERILCLVHNAVAKDQTGKDILNEAELHAVSDSWKPKDNREVQEYNMYNKGWRREIDMRLDTQTVYLGGQNMLLRASRVVDYLMWADLSKENNSKRLDRIGLNVDSTEALTLLLANSGMMYDKLVYTMTFQSLSKNLQEDLLALYPDAKTEQQYLDDEEILSDLFNGKTVLTAEVKDQLSAIIKIPHNKYAEFFASKGFPDHDWLVGGYFASLPIMEVVKRWAVRAGQSTEDEIETEEGVYEKMQRFADNHHTTAEALFKSTVRAWLDDGLFVTDYVTLCNSTGKDTCNDADTKLPHKKVFGEWLKAKNESSAIIQALVDSGQLQVEYRDHTLFEVPETIKIITGESLHAFKGNDQFAKDFKEQVEAMKPLASIILFLKGSSFLEDYATLLGFIEVYKQLSIIYEIELGYKLANMLSEFKKSIERLNTEIMYIADKLEEANYLRNNPAFSTVFFTGNMLIDVEKITPAMSEDVLHYVEEFKTIFLGNGGFRLEGFETEEQK